MFSGPLCGCLTGVHEDHWSLGTVHVPDVVDDDRVIVFLKLHFAKFSIFGLREIGDCLELLFFEHLLKNSPLLACVLPQPQLLPLLSSLHSRFISPSSPVSLFRNGTFIL
jgi:hypothetical protein